MESGWTVLPSRTFAIFGVEEEEQKPCLVAKEEEEGRRRKRDGQTRLPCHLSLGQKRKREREKMLPKKEQKREKESFCVSWEKLDECGGRKRAPKLFFLSLL